MSPRPEPRCFAFGDFTIDIQKRELKRLGEPVRLVGKPFDVLAYLIKNRERVVPAEELFHSVWKTDAAGERVFDPDYIQQAIAAIRRILGDNARNSKYVQTDRGCVFRVTATTE